MKMVSGLPHIALLFASLVSCAAPLAPPPPETPDNSALWARSATLTDQAHFRAIAVDVAGNVLAAGDMQGTGIVDFGNTVSATGKCPTNPLLVKYDSAGKALWAKTLSGVTVPADSDCGFKMVATDGLGNVYAAGYVSGTGVYSFDSGVTAQAAYSAHANALIVKYDVNGNALWAKSLESASGISSFEAICVDGSGNIYAAGTIYGNALFNFGDSTSAQSESDGVNPVLVKYTSAGTAVWAKTIVSAMGTDSRCEFSGVDTDASGNVFIAGYIYANNTYDFGSGFSITGITGSENPLLAKFDNTGTPMWLRTVTTGEGECEFTSVAVDTSGNALACGRIYGSSASSVKDFTFASGVTAWREMKDGPVLVKYNASGTAQWARTIESGNLDCVFESVSVDGSGNSYAAGTIRGVDDYGFGNSVGVAGMYSGRNPVLLRYSPSGTAQWALSVTEGTWNSSFGSVITDSGGNVYASGSIEGAGSYGFGNGIILTTENWTPYPVLIKYTP